MSDGIRLSCFTGRAIELARKVDSEGDNNGNLSESEISLFLVECENAKIEVKKEPWYSLLSKFFIDKMKTVEPQDATRVALPEVPELRQELVLPSVNSMILEEAKKRGVDKQSIDIAYWVEKIENVSEKYDVPPALLVSIIGQETNGKFDKNINSSNGAGPMQITTISIKDFFPEAKGNWYEIYKSMNADLLNDILYKKDEEGNFIKDAKGNNILKYASPQELRKACAENDELGMQVGLICFEMKYVKAVAKKEYGRATYANIPKVIKGLKEGFIILDENEQKDVVRSALKNYNSVYNSYPKAVIDSLSHYNFNYEDLSLIGKEPKQ